jgi:hypothetical protein
VRAPTLILALLTCWPATAPAQGSRVAVVARGEASLPLAQRLEAELSSLAFVPAMSVRDVSAPTEPEVVEVAAAQACAFVLVVSPELGAVEVWAVDPGTGRAVPRGTIAEPGDHPSIAVVAIRTVEHLRALEIEVAQAPVRPTAPEPSAPPLESPGVEAGRLRRGWTQHRLELGLGVGLQWAPGGAGASGQVLVEAAYMPSRWLGAHVMGVAPMVPAVVTGPEGDARIWPGLVGGGLRVRVMPVAARVGGAVDVGVAAAVLAMDGEANAPYRSLADQVWAAAPYLRPRLVIRLLTWLQLGVDLLVGVAVPRPIVRFATRDAATWGQPFLVVGVTLGGLLL